MNSTISKAGTTLKDLIHPSSGIKISIAQIEAPKKLLDPVIIILYGTTTFARISRISCGGEATFSTRRLFFVELISFEPSSSSQNDWNLTCWPVCESTHTCLPAPQKACSSPGFVIGLGNDSCIVTTMQGRPSSQGSSWRVIVPLDDAAWFRYWTSSSVVRRYRCASLSPPSPVVKLIA